MQTGGSTGGPPGADGPDLRPRVDGAGGLDLELPALSRSALDRAADRRGDDAWWASALGDPSTLFLPVAGGRLPLDRSAGGPRLAWTSRRPAGGDPHLLGIDPGGRVRVAVPVADPGDSRDPGDGPGAGTEWANLREVGGALSDLDAGAATHAVALLAWHQASGHSPRTGGATTAARSGSVRVDDAGHEFYPRTDPAMIVLVHEGDLAAADSRVLLGHQRVWPAGRFSCLAGFVEAGESLEQAVAREVAEESGVAVTAIRYAGSQPWPFPRSLMVGFSARAVRTEVRPDGEEIAELRWFTRTGLFAAVGDGTVLLPGRVSIARRLIEAWYGAELPGDW